MRHGKTCKRFGSFSPFPFSDLSRSKLRPCVVLALSGKGDWILCQITSKQYADPKAIKLTSQDLRSGSLRITSFVRPGKLFTANASLIVSEVGKLKQTVLDAIITTVIDILKD